MFSYFLFCIVVYFLISLPALTYLFQHKLKSSQKDKVKKFIAFTQTGEATAIFCLAQNEWKLELASDNYFQNPQVYYKEPKISVDRKKLEQLFSKYRGKLLSTLNAVATFFREVCSKLNLEFLIADPQEPEKMTADGIVRFLDDLNLSPDSKLVLIIAWKFRAAAQCEFSREEFMTGMTELGYVTFIFDA